MARRVVLLLTLGLVLCAPALAGDSPSYGQQQASLDAKLASVQAKITAARAREASLNTQIGGLTTQIQSLEGQVGSVATKLSALQADLALRQRRLDKLNELFTLQTIRLGYLRSEYTLSVQRLDRRLVDIYKQDEPSTVDVLLAARSFQDVLDQLDYLNAIAAQDKHVAAEVGAAKRDVTVARAKTKVVRAGVQHQQWLTAAREQQVAQLRLNLLAKQSRLAGARLLRSHALAATKVQEQAAVRESQAIQAASAALAAKIRASEAAASSGSSSSASSPPATPSAAGLIWPVSGPITSPFGPRWGGFHPGIDIGVPEGTPIHAAAAGTVIWCGWESGYGNLVVLDHHNGLATAYGHQSRIAVSCGQDVAQGDVIGYSGCTGFCTGPHLHFEVRVNGSPVDPIGYLP
jgi:murein DD-endopeptidase MepM/ murein hydrolase activator NlpD